MSSLHGFAACARHAVLLLALAAAVAQSCSNECACVGRRRERCKIEEWDAVLLDEGAAKEEGASNYRTTEVYVQARTAGFSML